MSYFSVGLDNPKNSINVGQVLRNAQAFGAMMVTYSGKRYKRSPTDVLAAYKQIPLLWAEDLHEAIPFNCVPVAVELVEGACSLVHYRHPENAYYVFGAEDATLGKRTLSWCRDIIQIPSSRCLNLAACTAVVFYDRMMKDGL